MQAEEFGSAFGVPHPYSVIIGPADEALAIWGERHAAHTTRESRKAKKRWQNEFLLAHEVQEVLLVI